MLNNQQQSETLSFRSEEAAEKMALSLQNLFHITASYSISYSIEAEKIFYVLLSCSDLRKIERVLNQQQQYFQNKSILFQPSNESKQPSSTYTPNNDNTNRSPGR